MPRMGNRVNMTDTLNISITTTCTDAPAIIVKPKNRLRAAYNLIRHGKLVTDEYTLPEGFMSDYHEVVHSTEFNYDERPGIKRLGVFDD